MPGADGRRREVFPFAVVVSLNHGTHEIDCYHEKHENKKQGVGSNGIRAERSEQETDRVICELHSQLPVLN